MHIAQTLAWLRPEYLDWITGDTIARLVEKKPQGWCIAAVGLRIRYRWQAQTRNPAHPISPYALEVLVISSLATSFSQKSWWQHDAIKCVDKTRMDHDSRYTKAPPLTRNSVGQ